MDLLWERKKLAIKCLLSYQRSQDFEDRIISFNFVVERKRRESTESVFARSLLVILMRIVVAGGR